MYLSIEQDEEVLAILIEDNGCGIPEEIQPLIFKKGFSTKNSLDHGIGLYLIKEMVEKANGTIQVESDPGRGT
ncbi:sensor histidine kinase, partial [Alkalihalophilus lindianensis]|uniref:sensor histidine kinase n=1 Tax=Alkalihalophilus lindianensis TaxID=1630542 RepID=UPI0034DE7B3D